MSASTMPAPRESTLARLARLAIVVLLLALVVVLALAFRREPQDIRTGSVGRPAPAFELESLDGSGTVSLAGYEGKVVVVNFFASWCIPCKEESVALGRAWERYRGSDVVIVGILYQDTRDAGLDFQRRLGSTWPSAFDADGRTAIAFGVFGIPETFFIGRDGTVEGRHIGPIDEEKLTRAIEALREKGRGP